MNEADPSRQQRRRSEHERQTVVFGIILAIMAVAGLIGAAVYSDTVDLPFLSRPFATEPAPVAAPVPCPPDGTLPVAAAQITVNVLNGTGLNGLAAQTAGSLQTFGFAVGDTGNAPTTVTTVGTITFGPAAIAQAYTLALYLPDAELVLDAARTDPTIDLTIGKEFEELDQTVVLDLTTPLVGRDGCVPLADLVTAAATSS